MSLQLIKDTESDFRNAQYLAKAAELAYMSATEGPPAYQSELGLDAKLVSVDNTQAFVGTNDAAVVVAFRGTESPTSIEGLKDWLLTNANNYLIAPSGESGADFTAAGVGAQFHRGFLEALHEVWPDGAIR